MQSKTRHPGTDNGKTKFFGENGIDIPVPDFNEQAELVAVPLQQSAFERGWFIRFNQRCRDLRTANGVEKMRAEVHSKVQDLGTFCEWMNEKAPRTAAVKTVDVSGIDKPMTQAEVAKFLEAQGIKTITA